MPNTMTWLRESIEHDPCAEGVPWRVASLKIALRNLTSAIHAIETSVDHGDHSRIPDVFSDFIFERLSRFFGAYCVALNPLEHAGIPTGDWDVVQAAEALATLPLGTACLRDVGLSYCGDRWDVDYLKIEFYMTTHADRLLLLLEAAEPAFAALVEQLLVANQVPALPVEL